MHDVILRWFAYCGFGQVVMQGSQRTFIGALKEANAKSQTPRSETLPSDGHQARQLDETTYPVDDKRNRKISEFCFRSLEEGLRFRGCLAESKKLRKQLRQSPQSESHRQKAEQQIRTSNQKNRMCRCSMTWADSALWTFRHSVHLLEKAFAFDRFAWTEHGKWVKSPPRGPSPILSAETTYSEHSCP